jgi:hypothetical protein
VTVTVTASQIVKNVTLRLAKAGSITGSIATEAGKLLPDYCRFRSIIRY